MRLPLYADWWNESREFAGVIRVRQQLASIGQIAEDIALIAESYTPDEARNRVFYAPL